MDLLFAVFTIFSIEIATSAPFYGLNNDESDDEWQPVLNRILNGISGSSYPSCQIQNYQDKIENGKIYTYLACYRTVLEDQQPLRVVDDYDIKYVVFKYSNLSVIPFGVFGAFASMTELYLSENLVTSIEPGAFAGLNKLEHLYLEDNNITGVSRNIFSALPNLKTLRLECNHIKTIEDKSFLGLHVVRGIHLNHNQLEKLPFDIFQDLNNLGYVNLSHNNLIEIPDCRLGNLANLDFSHNNLTNLDFFLFHVKLTYLNVANNKIRTVLNWHNNFGMKHLDLSNNLIEAVEIFGVGLEYLNMSGNRLRDLNNLALNQLIELRVLDLSHNLVSNLNENAFRRLFNLHRLLLQNNKLDSIPIGLFGGLRSLTELNLSNNRIFEFEYGTFVDLTSLMRLDVSGNRLINLYERIFEPLKNLVYLNIGGNLMSSFDARDLVDYLSNLKMVELDGNPWNCKALMNIVRSFEKRSVFVIENNARETANVNGIGCFYQDSIFGTPSQISDKISASTSPPYHSFSDDRVLKTSIQDNEETTVPILPLQYFE